MRLPSQFSDRPLYARCRKINTYVALAADHLVAVVLAGKNLERGLNDTTAEAEDKVKGRLLFSLKSANILKLSSISLEQRHLVPRKYLNFLGERSSSSLLPLTFWML